MIAVHWFKPIGCEGPALNKKHAARIRIRDGEGYLYAAREVTQGFVKLGFSLHPEKRVQQLTGYFQFYGMAGLKFELIGKAPFTLRDERLLHGRLDQFRVAIGESNECYEAAVLSHPFIPEGLRSVSPAVTSPASDQIMSERRSRSQMEERA